MGKQLSVHVLVCRGDSTVLNNIKSVFEDCNIHIQCIAVDGYMSALAVLDEEEMDLDFAMCMDIGDASISTSLFYQGELVWCKNFAFGVGDVIKRIMHQTAMSRKSAETLIRRSTVWVADFPHMEVHRLCSYYRVGEQDVQYQIAMGDICDIMQLEYTRMFKTIKDTIPARFGHINRIVLTGGGAQTQGIIDLATTVMDANVRVGMPHKVAWNGNQKYLVSAALVGLIKYSQSHISSDSQSYIRHHSTEYTGNLISRIKQWFTDNI